MDQMIINWLFVGFGAAIGWVLKVVWDAIRDLKTDMKQIEHDLPRVYVRKDDFSAAMASIKDDFKELKHDVKDQFSIVNTTLNLISSKLDNKRNPKE